MTMRGAYPAQHPPRTPHPHAYLRKIERSDRSDWLCHGLRLLSRTRSKDKRLLRLTPNTRRERPERFEMQGNACDCAQLGWGVIFSRVLLHISRRSSRSGRDPPHSRNLFRGLGVATLYCVSSRSIPVKPLKLSQRKSNERRDHMRFRDEGRD